MGVGVEGELHERKRWAPIVDNSTSDRRHLPLAQAPPPLPSLARHHFLRRGREGALLVSPLL
jgi:hypothetical protein